MQKLKGNEIMLIPVLMLIFSLGVPPMYVRGDRSLLRPACRYHDGRWLRPDGRCRYRPARRWLRLPGSTVNPFAVGAAVDALTGVGIEVNQSIIIGLGAVLWIVTTAMSIFFVMSYAKKVKADKGSTILSMQELKDAEEAHGKAASEVHNEVKLTGRQKGVLIAFAFTFVVMIVGFIPLADLNEGVANFFDAGAVYDADGNTVVQGWSA